LQNKWEMIVNIEWFLIMNEGEYKSLAQIMNTSRRLIPFFYFNNNVARHVILNISPIFFLAL
jgi:hypothetical protein